MSNHNEELSTSGRRQEIGAHSEAKASPTFDVLQLHKEGAIQKSPSISDSGSILAAPLKLGQSLSDSNNGMVSAVYNPDVQNRTNLSGKQAQLEEVHWHGGNYGYHGYGGNWSGNNIGPIIGGLLLWEVTNPRYYNPPPQYYVEPQPRYYVEPQPRYYVEPQPQYYLKPLPPPVYYEQNQYFRRPLPDPRHGHRQWDYDDGW